jgi:hypothetical protein
MKVDLGQPVGITISPSDDVSLTGASTQIQGILRESQRTFGNIGDLSKPHIGPWVLLFVILLILGAALVGSSFTSSIPTHTLSTTGVAVPIPGAIPVSNSGQQPWGIAALALCAFILLGGVAIGRNRSPRGTLVLAYRAEAPTWWQKNRTAVGIGLATSVGSSIVFFFFIGKAVGS